MKRTILLFLFWTMSISTTFAQCAMCRATVNSNLSEGRGVIGTGINFGILYMLMTPYLIVGVMVYLYFRVGKKELAKRLSLKSRIDEIYN